MVWYAKYAGGRMATALSCAARRRNKREDMDFRELVGVRLRTPLRWRLAGHARSAGEEEDEHKCRWRWTDREQVDLAQGFGAVLFLPQSPS